MKPSSGKVLAARNNGTDKTRAAAPQKGKCKPHCQHPKWQDPRLVLRGGKVRLLGQGVVPDGISS
jgi:hypothetical protein